MPGEIERWRGSNALPIAVDSSSKASVSSILADLKASRRLRDLERGKSVAADAFRQGMDSNLYVASSLIGLYAKCGRMIEAQRVFDAMEHRDLVAWNALILGYACNGECETSLELFSRLCSSTEVNSCVPDSWSFLAALKACVLLTGRMEEHDGKLGVLEKSMALHCRIASNGCEEIIVANTLIDLYAKCGSMPDARRVFDGLEHRDVVSWTALLLGYVENGQGNAALELLPMMESHECFPDARLFVAAIKACSSLAASEQGRQVDGMVVSMAALEKGMAVHSRSKLHESSNIYVGSSLVDMYAKCGSMADASRVFGRMKQRDVISWNALILGYAENGEAERALELFVAMQAGGCPPDSRTFVAALKACSRLAVTADFGDQRHGKMEVLEKSMALHSQARKAGGCDSSLYVGSSLVDVYSKCASMGDASSVFEKMAQRNVVAWTALILGYADNGQERLALETFRCLRGGGVVPNALTYVACLKACSGLASDEETRELDGKLVKMVSLENALAVHSQAARDNCDRDMLVASRLIDAYAESQSMDDAARVFAGMPDRDAVAWNELMLGYVENGDGELALEAFTGMRRDGCVPNAGTFVAALKACIRISAKEEWQKVDGSGVKLRSLETGMAIHSHAAAQSLDSDVYVANTLLDMYANCGGMLEAERVFGDMPRPGVVSWTALISGYTENGQGRVALELLSRMETQGCQPDARTLAIALKACGSVGALEAGMAIHGDVCKRGLESDTVVVTCLIDFYAKCGSMASSQQVFDALASRDAVAWTALLAGYSRGGDAALVFETFHEMVDEGVKVCGMGFQCLLAVCSHSGLVDTGRLCFDAMQSKYKVRPGREHYHCVIDLLSRANQLEEALDMVEAMPFEPTFVTWTTVLSAWTRIQVNILKFSPG
ncbi:pentatricopeptide repeat-containing protein At3g09040, mitochondrial-like [Selaginella moellendorffii]|uniref:pentatricopeptide repeat-containing protein At3g09040, mitochondrial-like n=1 Tax=Selaginella moellendorffii TaxID=88036 RepID=UPI000D1CA6A5|nr:pentatricopeptide repeat-containing protein At3g09040, mitochondrial-like [Selaginella moellendorffii]|eukprot:XP_024533019.1 pentatricopeptide repeat-containing protein At3g09040, mitochondrial-like [Selaginella moellendorffii]